MSDQNASPRPISLNDLGQKYFSAIQRLSDLIVFSWAGSNAVSAEGYDETMQSISGLPATPFRLPFEAIKQENELWLLKHSLNEVLGLSMLFLEDIRKMAGLVAFNAAKAKGTGDLVALAAEINAISQADFPTRLKQLEERHQVVSPIALDVLSLTGLAHILFQRNGVVGNGETLQIRLKAVQPPAEGESQPRIGDYVRTWKSGERVTLTREEHAAIFTTVSLFVSTFLSAIQEYAQRSGLTPDPVA